MSAHSLRELHPRTAPATILPVRAELTYRNSSIKAHVKSVNAKAAIASLSTECTQLPAGTKDCLKPR